MRIVVTAVQGMAAWLLIGMAPPAVALARLGFVLSAVLLMAEVGFRLAPTSWPPGLRTPVVAAYALYAMSCLRGLALIERGERGR